MGVPALSKQLQSQMDAKANECKKIKADLEATEQLKPQFIAVENASPSHEIGPTVRCFRLGQNWKQFSECATSLGYQPSIALNQSFKTSLPTNLQKEATKGLTLYGISLKGIVYQAFEDSTQLLNGQRNVFRAGPVTAMLDKQNTVQALVIGDPQFFGTEIYDRNFIQELMSNYRIPELNPQVVSLTDGLGSYLKYEGDGWGIIVSNENVGRYIAFYKTGSQKKDYKF